MKTQYNLYVGCVLLLVLLCSIMATVRSFTTEKDKIKSQKAVHTYRDGIATNVMASDLVCGDIVQISHGDLIPADIRIVDAENFEVDSSSTFQQASSIRIPENATKEENPFLAPNIALYGSVCTKGTCRAMVAATGADVMLALLVEERARHRTHTQKREKSCLLGVWNRIIAEWFLLGMFSAIGLAAVVPQLGSKQAPLVKAAKYFLVPLVFFFSGLTLKTRELKKALLYCKLNVLIQIFNLVYIPALVYGLAKALESSGFNSTMVTGLIIMSSVPTTVSMCNILTTSSGGNASISVINAAMGNFLGVFVTPVILLLLLGSESSIEIWPVVEQLLQLLLLPLVVGQGVQFVVGPARVANKVFKKAVGTTNKLILVVILFKSFCKTFSGNIVVDTESLVSTLGICIGLYLIFLLSARLLFALPCLKIARRDQVPAWFCSTHKTVALGVPLIAIIFEGREDLGIIQLPLLMIHPTQLMVGTLLVPKIERWAAADQAEKTEEKGDEAVQLVSIGDQGVSVEDLLAQARVKAKSA